MYGDIHLFSLYNHFMNMMEITAQMRENKKIEFKTIFSCINNYENCFKYDKIKVSRLLDKYTE